jgi:hypothetical protein
MKSLTNLRLAGHNEWPKLNDGLTEGTASEKYRTGRGKRGQHDPIG